MNDSRPKIRTLIVDDEPLARKKLRALLSDEADIAIVGECSDGREALAHIRQHKPDLVFLDIQMPEMNGFEALNRLEQQDLPALIFVTAYDQFAVAAFEYHALDYLLKPFDAERLQKALERARRHGFTETSSNINAKLQQLLDELNNKPTYLRRIMIKQGGELFFVNVDDIDWIEAAGNYVNLHIGAESHLLRETMSSLANNLDPQKFVRIHRSQIVNIDRIEKLKTAFNGEYAMVLKDGARLTLTRTYRDNVLKLLEQRS